MKRRKAIGNIILGTGAIAAGFGGYEWYSLVKNPDKSYLLTRKLLLSDLAEVIIPATDTPGAKEAGAVEFMINILMECVDTKTLNRFVDGLKQLESYTKSKFNCEFSACKEQEKVEVLQYFYEQSKPSHTLIEKAKNRYTGRPFFQTLKLIAVHGYCISVKGASIGMRYIAVPGKYLSCIPLEANQPAWATK